MARAVAMMIVLLLAACAPVDSDQRRICRQALAALHPAGTSITITGLTRGGAPHSIAISHETARGVLPPRERIAECRFGGGAMARGRLDLVAVTIDGRPLSPAELLFLQRFWLDDPATNALQPPPTAAERLIAPQLSRTVAIPLQHALLSLPQIAIYALLAPAFALIYGLIGRINLAFGELAIIGGQGALLGAAAGGLLTDGAPLGMLVGALLVAGAASLVHAEIIGRHVIAPLARSGGQPLLVATAGLSAALMEYVRLSQGDGPRWLPPLLGTPVLVAEADGFPVTVTQGAILFSALALGVSLALLAALRHLPFGRQWRATAEEPVAAALMGVDTRAVLIASVALSGLLAGLAGFIITMHYGGIGFSGGLAIGLKALIAAILGGIGSVGGAMLGAVVLGLMEAAWAAVLPLHLREAAIFTLLVALLTVRPGGLFGHAGRDARRDGDMR
jgi:branched-chain amino acid transport system permease protein